MKLVKKRKALVLIFAMAIILITPQMVSGNMVIGSDSIFHFNRFYDTAMQIKHHTFSPIISLFGFQQSARAVNALYGPLFAYLQGGLLLLAGSWFKYQILANFFLYLLSGFSMYLLAKKIGCSTNSALFAGIIFMTTYSVQYWINRQGFTSWGAAVLPLVIASGTEMLTRKRIKPLTLAMSLAVVTQIHLFSSVLAVLILAVFFVHALIYTNNRIGLLKNLVIAITLYCLLTLNIWISLYELYSGNHLAAPFSNPTMELNTIFCNSYYWLINPLWMGLLLMYVLVQFFKERGKQPVWVTYFGGLSAVFLVLCTNLVPWSEFSAAKSFLASFLQFPFRFFIPVSIFTIVLFAYYLDRIDWCKKGLTRMLMAISLVQCLALSFYTLGQWETQHPFLEAGRHTRIEGTVAECQAAFYHTDLAVALKLVNKATPDYLPIYGTANDNLYEFYREEIIDNQGKFEKEVVGNTLVVRWQAEIGGEVTVPIIKYKNTRLNKVHTVSHIGTVNVNQKSGENELKVAYVTPVSLYIGYGVVIVMMMVVSGWGVFCEDFLTREGSFFSC